MAEIALPLVVTAIANSEQEGFVAGTLFSEGWNVIHRALDAHSLSSFLENFSNESENVILIYSPDLSDLSPNLIAGYQRVLRPHSQTMSHMNAVCTQWSLPSVDGG